MFTSPKVPTFIQSVKFAGDAERPLLAVAFYITPLTYDLAYEMSDRIAKQLFRREGTQHTPVQEFGVTVLNLGELPAYNLELYPHDADGADGAGQMIPSVKVTKVSVDKLFTDSPDWSLIWHATLPLDSHALALVHTYYKKTCFITLEAAQEELFDKKPQFTVLDDAEVESAKELLCQSCNERAVYMGTDQSAWCGEHVGAAVGIQVRRIRYTEGAA